VRDKEEIRRNSVKGERKRRERGEQ